MKNQGIILIFFLLTLSCEKNKEITINIPDNYFKNGVFVSVDPRLELLAVAQHFTSWADDHHTNLDFNYPDEVESYFSLFSNHAAITKCQELRNIGFTYDAPVNYILFHDNPPDLTRLVPYSDYLIGRSAGEENLNDFTDKLKTFSLETDFMSFYDDHRIFYDKMLTLIFNVLGDKNYIDLIEQYYGESKYRYTIIPVPLFDGGAYGVRVDLPEGQYVYHVMGPTGLKSNVPTFGSESGFKHLLLHEFSHSFVNHVTDIYINDINKSSILFEPIKEQMKNQAYNSWYVCVNEHLVRINVIRIRVISEGEGIKQDLLNFEKSKGFIYITQLDTLMQRYESNRSEFPKYEDFYPEIVNLFNVIAGIK